MSMTMRGGVACLLVLLLAAGTGCGGAEEESAGSAASDFISAIAAADTGQACRLLAPNTVEVLESQRPEGCQQALPSLGLPADPVTEVQVWGDTAQARTAGDVLFLRELAMGWRVVAAGCRPQGDDQPYECALEGS